MKLLLVDPSLKDYAGHHHEYAEQVLQAARQAGCQTLLAANRRFSICAATAADTFRFYKYGYWSRPGIPRSRWLRQWSKPVAARTETSDRAGRSKPSLSSQVVAELADGAREFSDRVRIRQFTRDTVRLVRAVGLGPGDLVFLPMAGRVELEGVLRAVQRVPEGRLADWHLLFRFDPPAVGEDSSIGRRLAGAFRHAAAERSQCRLHFHCDTEELSRLYEQFSGLPFHTLPIPHADVPLPQPPSTSQSVRILCLGGARKEKGFQHLPAIIRQLRKEWLSTGRATFLVQANADLAVEEPEVMAARQQLQAMAVEGVTLFTEALSPDDYCRLLGSGDMILLAYEPQAYRARSSGVLVEALAAGIPAIVPANTWLARQIPPAAPGSVPVGLTYTDVGELPSLIETMVRHCREHRAAATAFAPSWIERHNARRLVESLLAESNRT